MIEGGPGNDYIECGTGNDSLIFGPNFGSDIVADFKNSGDIDRILFDTDVFADFAAVQAHMFEISVGGNSAVVIMLDTANTIEFRNTTLGQLTAGDFAFF